MLFFPQKFGGKSALTDDRRHFAVNQSLKRHLRRLSVSGRGAKEKGRIKGARGGGVNLQSM